MSEPTRSTPPTRRLLRVLPASAVNAADAPAAADAVAADGAAPVARVAPEPVDPVAVQAAFDRLSAIFSDMMVTVADVSTRRCPYKNRLDKCTAKFGCRNQLRPTEPGGLKVCGGDDKLDYRSAWETS